MRNWKTSLAGILGGLLITIGPQIGTRLSGDHTLPPITLGNLTIGVALAVLGVLAKDKDVTGGTRPQ